MQTLQFRPSSDTSAPQAAPSTTPPQREHAEESCCGSKKNCDTCLKGGMPMKKEILSFVVILLIGVTTVLSALLINEKRQALLVQEVAPTTEQTAAAAKSTISPATPAPKSMSALIDLPAPKLTGDMSVEEALASRRSGRVYSDKPVTLSQLSQVLWSGQGITQEETGYRTAPSARSIFPYTLYLVARNIDGLDDGLYQYLPKTNQLGRLDLANAGELLSAAGVQDNSQKAPAVVVMSAAVGMMVEKFPNNPVEVAMLEGGHIGQNISLQVEALDMATVVTAGFDPKKVGDALRLDPTETVVYLIPFGHPGEEVATEE